ncbi:MAG: AraC family transcriptional regulator [Candidatus Eisenbacteria bacterium]|nr:AraC family transcriptional regulator [Candidatus Eisenbacteria bacterium]
MGTSPGASVVGLKRVCLVGQEAATVTALGRLLGRDYYLTVKESIGDFLSTLDPKVRSDGLVLGAQCSNLERMRLADALESEQLHLFVFVFASPDRIFVPDPLSRLKVQGFFRKPREILKLAEALRRVLGPAREGQGVPVNDARSGMVAGAIEYIEKNLVNIKHSTDVNRHLGVSREHLSREFTKYTGRTLWDFINLCRVERARELLQGDRLLVKQVFSEAGFNCRSSFFRAFLKHTGLAPGHYRQLLPERQGHG